MFSRLKGKKRSPLFSYFGGYGTSDSNQTGIGEQSWQLWVLNLSHAIEDVLRAIDRYDRLCPAQSKPNIDQCHNEFSPSLRFSLCSLAPSHSHSKETLQIQAWGHNGQVHASSNASCNYTATWTTSVSSIYIRIHPRLRHRFWFIADGLAEGN